jgi:hypothetical protein
MVLENAYRWKGSASGSQWAVSAAGQQQEIADVRDLVHNLPSGRGLGMVYWYPEAIQVPNNFIYNGGASALFDDSGYDALPAVSSFSISSPTWTIDADGTWYNASNWSGGVPMFAGNVANFGNAITAPRTITMNNPQTLGTINFSNSVAYTIAGTNTITLQTSTGQSAINVTSGNHTISAPLTLASDTTISVAANSSVSLTGNLAATGRTITKTGQGAAIVQNIKANALNITGGVVRATSGTSSLGSLSIASGSALDLTNNALTIAYSSLGSLLTDTRNQLLDGRLTTSSSAGGHALGYADNGSNILIQYACAGDANLDGKVNALDFNALSTGYGSGSFWTEGDFNYDGVIDTRDFAVLAANFNHALPAGLTAVVPEPAMGFLLLATTVIALRRTVANLKV